jgi:predicted Zn-dependent protease
MQVSDRDIEKTTKTVKAFRKSAAEITDKEEYYIGRSVAANILSRYPAVSDEKLNKYVQAVLQSVAAASDRPETFSGWHAQVVESDELNAVSAPGGFVFVTTGLLSKLSSEDELAAVLAHEVAHVAAKHGLKTIKASRLTKAFELLGAQAAERYASKDLGQLADLFGGSVDDIVGTLVINGYSRDKEYEADKLGAEFARRANYDPGALARFIQALGSAAKGGGLLKTHPSPKSRLKELGKQEASDDYKESPARDRRFASALGR